MDGITTAASAFAVVSVAGQLAVGVKKLHSFWNSLQDAPDDVKSLSRELKLLLTILGEIEESEQRYGPNAASTDVLESCNAQINSLTAITERLERGFTTRSSSRRKWGALKAVFKRDTIKNFQDILRDTKVSLLLAQQNGFRHTLKTHHDSQRDQLSTFINELRLQINASPLAIRPRAAQPYYESHAGAMQSEVCRMATTVPNPIFRGALKQGVGRALEEHPRRLSAHGGGPQPATSECQSDLASSLQRGEGTLTGRSHSVVENLFGTFSISSEVRQLAMSNNKDSEDLDSDDFVRTTSIRIHPARWLIRLGINFGIQFAAQGGPQCWKHTLTSYRAVPDDAAIFSACRRGDLDCVTKLLTDGKASIWDTDSNGMTPIHFAADSCHAHLCRFLISKGADKTSPATSNYRWSPLMLAAGSQACTQSMKIDTLRFFLSEIDFSKAAEVCSSGWRVLLLIVDYSRSHDLTFQWLLQSVASEITMHFRREPFINLFTYIALVCDPHLQLVPSMLRLGDDHIGKVLDMESAQEVTPIYRSIICRSHTANLLMKGANPHLTCDPEFPWDSSESLKSPTSLAMLSSRMFDHWRKSLRLSGLDLKDFVKRECESGSVADEGWNEDTLLYLFQSEIEDMRIDDDEGCDRCDKTSWELVVLEVGCVVEVGWCLKLDKIKKRYAGHAGKDKVSTPNTDSENGDQQKEEDVKVEEEEAEEEEDVEEGKGIHCPCVQRYAFVCCKCWKDLQDPNHKHRDISKTSSSAAIEELSDWEDSPFLLSI